VPPCVYDRISVLHWLNASAEERADIVSVNLVALVEPTLVVTQWQVYFFLHDVVNAITMSNGR
jgi:hypothetical protein